PSYVAGRVVHVDDDSPVTTGGTVLVELSDGTRSVTVTTKLHPDGTFAVEFRDAFGPDLKWGRADYLGSFGAAPSTTGEVAPQ
ncbi:hypothetical protein, partial [Mycobacterium tuberculosis]